MLLLSFGFQVSVGACLSGKQMPLCAQILTHISMFLCLRDQSSHPSPSSPPTSCGSSRLLGQGSASFDGLGHIWRDFWSSGAGHVLPTRLRRILLNSWFMFETLSTLCPKDHLQLQDIPMRLDRNDHEEIHRVFGRLERVLRRHFREVYGRRHQCGLCQRYRSVGVDVIQGVTCHVCVVQTGSFGRGSPVYSLTCQS